MFVLHAEHDVPDYDRWKSIGFDADPLGRRAMGVKAYRVGRSLAEPNHVMIELEFDSASEAEHMASALRDMWVGAQQRGLIGAPTLSAFEIVEAKQP